MKTVSVPKTNTSVTSLNSLSDGISQGYRYSAVPLSHALVQSDSATSIVDVSSQSNGLGIIGGNTVSGISEIPPQLVMADATPTPSPPPSPTVVPGVTLPNTLEGATISANNAGTIALNTGLIPALPTVVVPSPDLLNSIQVPQANSQIESIEDIVLPEASAVSQMNDFAYGKTPVLPNKTTEINEQDS